MVTSVMLVWNGMRLRKQLIEKALQVLDDS